MWQGSEAIEQKNGLGQTEASYETNKGTELR